MPKFIDRYFSNKSGNKGNNWTNKLNRIINNPFLEFSTMKDLKRTINPPERKEIRRKYL